MFSCALCLNVYWHEEHYVGPVRLKGWCWSGWVVLVWLGACLATGLRWTGVVIASRPTEGSLLADKKSVVVFVGVPRRQPQTLISVITATL